MPKGSKKRRAEKRKKEKEANTTSPTNSAQGSEDLKSLSDSGEVSFSSSSNSDAQNSRLGHEVVGSEAVSKSRSVQRSEEDGEVTRDLLVQKEKQSRGGGDSVKETSSDSGSYSGSSSDDESEEIEKTKEEEEEEVVEVVMDLLVQKEKLTEEEGNSVKRIVNIESVNDSVKETSRDSGSGRSNSGFDFEVIEKNKDEIDLVTETTSHSDLIEKIVAISEDVEIIESNMTEKTGDSGVVDLPNKEVIQVRAGGDVSSCESSNGYEHPKEATITENSNNKPAAAPSIGKKSNGYEHEFEATSPETSEKQRSPATPLSSEDTNESKHHDEAMTTATSDNQNAASTTLISDVSIPYERHTETTTPEIAEKKPQIASASPTLQPTSWKSCCGLFDVFMGSNR